MDWISSAWAWLLSPLSGSPTHVVDFGTAWHGRLMVLGWAFAVPVGVLLGRFYKVVPGQQWPRELDNPFWFRSHRAFEYAAGVLMVAAVALMMALGDPAPSRAGAFHAGTGWTLLALGWAQLLASHLRGSMGGPREPFTRRLRPVGEWRGDHFDMTPRRVVFELVHKSAGYGLVALSAVALLTGLAAADALRWMWIAIALWWMTLVAAFVHLQQQGRAIDCYQAIWGVDADLPGNRRTVRWGVRRYTPASLRDAPWPKRPHSTDLPRD